jgi:hypothetical protein
MQTTIASLTKQMHNLERAIVREQKYIAEFGAQNDAKPCATWASYKADAAARLTQWDSLKAKRDALTQ